MTYGGAMVGVWWASLVKRLVDESPKMHPFSQTKYKSPSILSLIPKVFEQFKKSPIGIETNLQQSQFSIFGAFEKNLQRFSLVVHVFNIGDLYKLIIE